MENVINKKFFFLIILFTIFLNLTNFYSIEKKYNKFDNLNTEHKIVKGEILKYWKSAHKSDTKTFQINDRYRNAYLYPKFLYFLSKIFNFDFYDNYQKVSLDPKIYIFLVQYLIFLLSVIFFYKVCSKNLDLNHLKIFIIILLLDPNLNQHHYALFTESIFISLLLLNTSIFIHFIFTEGKLIKFLFLKLILMGVLLGLMFLTRSVSIYYIFVIVLLFLFLKKYFYTVPLILGYMSIIIFIGLNNIVVNDKFRITPTQGGDALYGYLAADIYAYKNNLSISEVRKLFFIENVSNFLGMQEEEFREKTSNFTMQDIIKINEFKSEKAIEVIFDDLFASSKIIVFHYSKSLFIYPFWVKNFYKKNYIPRDEYDETNVNLSFQNQLRIIYSIIFYMLVLFGLYLSIKKLNWKLNCLIFFTAGYYFVISGFAGNPRYFLPSYVILCFYLALSLNYFFLKMLIFKNNKIK